MRNVVVTRLWHSSLLTIVGVLCGCAAKQSQTAITPQMVASARDASSQAPYALQAESSGPMADFKLYNMGTSDMKIERSHFAIVQPGENRALTPYKDGDAIIDLPLETTLKPGATLQGKAMFTGYNKMDGLRLVYKPDNKGTYADIQPKP